MPNPGRAAQQLFELWEHLTIALNHQDLSGGINHWDIFRHAHLIHLQIRVVC
jgi:hypothetical protein